MSGATGFLSLPDPELSTPKIGFWVLNLLHTEPALASARSGLSRNLSQDSFDLDGAAAA